MSTVSPDVEALCVAILRQAMPEAEVRTKYTGGQQIRVSLAGGPRQNMVVDRPMVTVQSWAPDSVTALEQARLAHAHLWAAAGAEHAGVWVRTVRDTGGLTFYPDPDTDDPRYQFTVELNLRPAPLEA